MAVRKFLAWAQAASPVALAEGADKLARAFLYGECPEPEREDMRRILTALLDHPSPLVRRALAEAFASPPNAPHYMVLALANDSSDVAALVLARSPLLSDAELVDLAATADAFAQSAIALRPQLSAAVAAALAEAGALEALIALARNPGAEILEFSVRRMVARFGHDGELRAALLERPYLSAPLRSDLALAAVEAAAATMTERALLPPGKAAWFMRGARERVVVAIAAEIACETGELANFAAYLRRGGQLTAGVLLRGLLCGNRHLLEAALCELTGIAMRRVAGLSADGKSAKFAALYRKAKLPGRMLPAFVAGLAAVAKSGGAGPANARLQRPLIGVVLEACAAANTGELDLLIAELRRLEAEAAREEARDLRSALARGSFGGFGFADKRRLPPAGRPQRLPAAAAMDETRAAPSKARPVSIDRAGEPAAAA